jgi:hypothetical protein
MDSAPAVNKFIREDGMEGNAIEMIIITTETLGPGIMMLLKLI